jgi:hypothetical protein
VLPAGHGCGRVLKRKIHSQASCSILTITGWAEANFQRSQVQFVPKDCLIVGRQKTILCPIIVHVAGGRLPCLRRLVPIKFVFGLIGPTKDFQIVWRPHGVEVCHPWTMVSEIDHLQKLRGLCHLSICKLYQEVLESEDRTKSMENGLDDTTTHTPPRFPQGGVL